MTITAAEPRGRRTTGVMDAIRPTLVLAGWAVRESLRRRVFVIVALLTVGFLALYAVGCNAAFSHLHEHRIGPVDAHEFAGATLLGLGMFAILFLGSVLAAFLTLSAVRGDAENGLLQPLVVRPVGRPQVLAARWLAAATVCSLYVAVVYLACLLVLRATGDWTPDRLLGPGVRVALA